MSSNPYTKFKLNDEEHRERYQEKIRPELIAAESAESLSKQLKSAGYDVTVRAW